MFKLKEPLRAGEQYFFEYWIRPINTSIKVNSFGLVVGIERMQNLNISGLIDEYPISMQEKLITDDSIKWHRISGTFESDDDYQYIIIGNFGSDKSMEVEQEENGLKYGYYLLDDVLLRPLYQNTHQKISLNETIILENILFEFDKATIIETSKPELDNLVKVLKSNDKFIIEIMGHTDNQGSLAHNLKLSQKRADSIKEYLTKNGVEVDRVIAKGMGSEYPIVSNDSEENRKINRRVEIKINERSF